MGQTRLCWEESEPISEITCVGVLQCESLRRSGRQTSPDRARSLGGASEVTDLAARGPWKASQRGPATVAGIRDAVRPRKCIQRVPLSASCIDNLNS
jgi:hypothetical protein